MSVSPHTDQEYYSQFGEDRILGRIFDKNSDGVCVEVGANNGRDGSTTLHFEQLGWRCVLVEPNPLLCVILRETRRGIIFECGASSQNGVAILQLAEGDGLSHAVSTLEQGADAANTLRRHGVAARPVEVTVRRLDDVLEESGIDKIDFITIDVEGHELSVLQGFSVDRWHPRILIIEDNSQAGDRRVRDHLRLRRYVRFRRTGVNDWYCKQDDRLVVESARRTRYAMSLISARSSIAVAPLKGMLARIPGVLPVVRWTRSFIR